MDQPKKIITQSSVEWATDNSLERINQGVRLALERTTDSRKKERRIAQKCKGCFYNSGRMGGAAMTTRPCGICSKDQLYGSTATDVICLPCAEAHQLCKECGADQELRPRRKFT